jgi:hypothetical protein
MTNLVASKTLLTLLISLALFCASPLASAEQFVENDDYVVHYSAFNSTMIQPNVADAYGLMRSRTRGILNISVQRKQPTGLPKAVMAQLKGFTGQLGGSEIPLDFQLVQEGDAIYYLAEFRFGDGDKLDFDISIKPTPQAEPLKIRFSQSFFAD